VKLSNDQLALMAKLVHKFPRTWRRDIGAWWWRASEASFLNVDEKAALQQLRNTLGPVWLEAYKPGDEQVGWLARGRLEVPRGAHYVWVEAYRIAHQDGKDMIQPYEQRKSDIRDLARQLKITLIEEQS